jgi:hypothetical protein
LTQATFTQAHHDGSGMGTWIFVSSGVKYWVVITPRDLPRATDYESIAKIAKAFFWENPDNEEEDAPANYARIVQAFVTEYDCSLEVIVAKAGDLMYVSPPSSLFITLT